MRTTYLNRLCTVVLLLVCSANSYEGSRRRARRNKGVEAPENHRRELLNSPLLFRTYGRAWESAVSGRSYVSTLETNCIKRPEKGGSGGKGGKSGKKSGKKSTEGADCNKSGKKSKSSRSCEESEQESGASGKKGSKGQENNPENLPYCDDSNDGSSQEGGSPTAPNSQPAPAPSPGSQESSTPAPTSIVDRESASVCDIFFAGKAPTNTDSIPFTVFLTLQTDGSRPTEEILVDVHNVLKTQVAPDVLGCSQQARQRDLENRYMGRARQLDDEPTEIVNVDFASLKETAPGSLVAAGDGAVYYTGVFPDGILATLRDAVANADFSGIPGLTGVNGIVISDSSGNLFVGPPTETEAPKPQDDGGIGSVRGTQEPPSSQSSPLSAGGYVGLAAAGLVLGLLILFVSRQRKRKNDSDVHERSLKHQQFRDVDSDDSTHRQRGGVGYPASTDDESEGYLSREETTPDRGEAFPHKRSIYQVAEVVDENSVWDDQSRNARFQAAVQGIETNEALNGHSCSSPTCEICQSKLVNPITFVTPGDPPLRESVELKSRTYIEPDTVEL